MQEKSEHWTKESLFLKLQDAYIDLQFDLPYFVTIEEVVIQEGKSETYLANKFLKDISLVIDGISWEYTEIDNLFISAGCQNVYSYHSGVLMLNKVLFKETTAKIVYKYEKSLKNDKCYIETPSNWKKALEYLLKAYVYEKPTRNTKERDVNKHYLNLYAREVQKLKLQQKARPKNLTSKYQTI